ncbi:hypothetical protein BJX76DRAFT_3107 [Aspergillus varians]
MLSNKRHLEGSALVFAYRRPICFVSSGRLSFLPSLGRLGIPGYKDGFSLCVLLLFLIYSHTSNSIYKSHQASIQIINQFNLHKKPLHSSKHVFFRRNIAQHFSDSQWPHPVR